MMQQTIDLRINPSEETIRLGPLTVRFFITGENSNGSIAAFDLTVPGAQRLAAPAHSHDHYEETIYGIDGVLTWTVDGKQIDVRPGQALCIPRGAIHRFDNNSPQEAKALWVIHQQLSVRSISVRRGDQCGGAPNARRWRRSCGTTASRQLGHRLSDSG